MERVDNNFDVTVIGAGPAGMMAALSAAENGAKTVLIEKNESAGKKLLLTGGGRCNITNLEPDLRKLVANYGKNGPPFGASLAFSGLPKSEPRQSGGPPVRRASLAGGPFLFHAFAEFGPKDAVDFFNKAGVETVIENNQRVFPKSGNAKDILETLVGRLKETGAEMMFDREVIDIKKDDSSITGIVLVGRQTITAKNYIISTGGKSYPGTGSTGDGYEWAHRLGHRIVKLSPALVPVETKEHWTKELSGINLKRSAITIIHNNKRIPVAGGEILFTHFGLSGPAILNASASVGESLETGEVAISINIFPKVNREGLEKKILESFKRFPNRTLKNCLAQFMPQNLAPAIARLANVDPEKTANNITKEERWRAVGTMQDIRLTLTGLLDIEAGMVTNGGVALENVDDKTMRSKIVKNLFFAGEIINVHGATGGFNLQQCWSTGHLAGASAAKELNKSKKSLG